MSRKACAFRIFGTTFSRLILRLKSDLGIVLTPGEVVVATRAWIERAVIGLNLCPFAKAVYVKDQIRYAVSQARDAGALLDDLKRELRLLARAAPHAVDTTLLIHPQVLTEFLDYNDFIAVGDAAIEGLGLAGVLQIASFHPGYQFAGTPMHDVTNYTNRSPYPMLQLLREASVTRAVAAFPEAQHIYQKNMETMRRLGVSGWEALGLAPTGRPQALARPLTPGE
jgi:hypothetical protein